MKPLNRLKYKEFETKADALLKELCARVPFLKVESCQPIQQPHDRGRDLLMELKVGNRLWVWMVQINFHAQPRKVHIRLLQMQSALYQAKLKNGYGVLVAPFFSERSARLCAGAGVGYMDLAGNARLSFDQVFIETRGVDNPFLEKRYLRSLFSAKSGQVLRVLLTPPLRSWKVRELEKASGVSRGQVSNVRKLLIDHEWAVIGEAGLRLNQPAQLAKAWQNSYRPVQIVRETAYTPLRGEALDHALRRAFAEAGNGAHAVLASHSAANWFAPYAPGTTHYVYTDEEGAEILKQLLHLQSEEGGEKVVLLEPHEDDVFVGRVEPAPGIWCSGLVQTWLDLGAAGEHGRDAADRLIREKLLPAWTEATLPSNSTLTAFPEA